jgi:hypothetical protein
MSGVKRYLLSRGELLCADTLKPASVYRMVDADDYDTLSTANQRLEQEAGKLKAVMANQSARQFVGHDDQRHIDDLVAAGIRASDAEMKRLEGEVARLREVVARSAEACGAYIDNACSLEFMELLPSEIKAKCAALRGKGGE